MSEEILQAPYFRVSLGHFDDQPPSRQGLTHDEEVNSRVTEITVEEQIAGADKFTIKIVDPEMNIMFDEYLFIGQVIAIKLGTIQNPLQKVTGFISAMKYEFPESGVPQVVVEGFGLVWDTLSKYKITWAITVGGTPFGSLPTVGRPVPTAPTPSLNLNQVQLGSSPTVAPIVSGHVVFATLKDMFQEIADANGLSIQWGSTIPNDIQDALYKSKAVIKFPAKNTSAWDFLQSLATEHGCWFFVRGRYLFFYPPTFVSTMMNVPDASIALGDINDQLTNPSLTIQAQQALVIQRNKQLSLLNSPKNSTAYRRPDPEAFVFYYKRDSDPSTPGRGYNLLNFCPELQNMQTAAALGMGLDPATGRISYGHTLGVEDKAKAARASPGTNEKQVFSVGEEENMLMSAPPATIDSEGIVDGVRDITVNPESVGKAYQQSVSVVSGKPGLNSVEMGGVADASFRKWMWFNKATATVKGNASLTCPIPIYIRGIGKRSSSGQSTVDNAKICGPWYVNSVKHIITANKSYLCELGLQRFWQMAKPPTADDVKKSLNLVVPEYLRGKTESVGKDIASRVKPK